MTTTTQVTGQLVEFVEGCYRDLDFDALGSRYRADVILDAHVPLWRFQLQGPAAVTGWFNEQIAHFENPRVTWVRATPTSTGGVVVEWEIRVGPDGEEHLCREIDLFHCEDREITEHVLWCTGMWDPATIERQRAEAPMVRW